MADAPGATPSAPWAPYWDSFHASHGSSLSSTPTSATAVGSANATARLRVSTALLDQKYEGGGDEAGKISVKEFCSKKGISVSAFKRFTLNEE